ncbi:MAG TPA: dihydrolipoyl dehydrogenase [Arenimonas sp.]|uniref:dihydrolipoyl dehydrogenase n=1 Tax=Arenimonas sp. TaxID=1872635 RepID=UPI002D8077CC|nr:dihydrolipoyl dehydrogenase [Arenimonas sp.]HEU0153002.1 dihydrolipoyl dehydrogenase [Arenimonas sp.]
MARPLDVIIIGAGTAGLSALREVRKRTDDFVLVNDGPYGTTCARVGCMPSKVLVEAANAFHARGKFAAFGIRGGEGLAVDLPAVLQRVRTLRDFFVAGVLEATADLGDRNLPGRARLLDAHTVQVGDRVLKASRIILATGARPVLPPAWRALGGRVLTTDALFEQTDLPRRIGVVGLGAIGIEMAQALARLGCEVTAFGRGERLAGLSDPEVNATLRKLLASEFALHTGADVALSAHGSGLRLQAGDTVADVDAVLVAIGRRPNLDDIGLEALGVKLDARGLPPFDPCTLQIADLPVYLAGDANAHAPILHEAADEGYIAGRNALQDTPDRFRRRTPLGIVFSDPGTAFVGTRFEALPAGTVIGEIDFTRQGRARTGQRNQGLLRVYAARADGRLLGAELCAPSGDHLAHLLALAIDRELTVFDLLRMPFYHPVIEEGLRTALRALARQVDGGGDASDLSLCPPLKAEALD